MQELEQTIDSREVAEMMGLEHWRLLRKLDGRTGTNGKHIKGYIEILGDNQVVVTDFFRKSSYTTEQNKEMSCYKVTKKGCEFLANKFTGEKGVVFTAKYVNRFHEMQDILSSRQTELIQKKELLTNRIIKSIGEVNEALREKEDPNLLVWIFQDMALLAGNIANIERLKRGEKI